MYTCLELVQYLDDECTMSNKLKKKKKNSVGFCYCNAMFQVCYSLYWKSWSPLHAVKYSLCIYGLVFNNLELFSKHKNDNKFKYNLLRGKTVKG